MAVGQLTHLARPAQASLASKAGTSASASAESISGCERVVKATLTAAAATLGALAAHVAGGAAAPTPVAVLVTAGLAALVALPLSGRAVSLARLAAVVATAQLLFHLLFLLGAPTEAMQLVAAGDALAAGHGAHGGHAVAGALSSAGGPLLAHALHLTPPMLAAHAIAATATLVALAAGERVMRAIVDAARSAWRQLSHTAVRAAALVVASTPRRSPVAIPGWGPAPARPTDAVLVWTGSRRGPPPTRA